MSPADEDAAGVSADLGDEGAALQRAPDKIAAMQARAGALDELPQSGVLEDVGGDTDDIQQELDEAGSPPKWTRSSPRLRPRSARAYRHRPSQPGAEARALQPRSRAQAPRSAAVLTRK
jgi:phage shock protein A